MIKIIMKTHPNNPVNQTSEKWWMCTDGAETGYLPPHCLLVTQQEEGEEEEEEEESEFSSVDLDITSILKSESDDEVSSPSRYTT